MKKITGGLVFIAAAFAMAQPASAQGWGVEGTGARARGEWGGELGVGYGLGFGPLQLRPIVGAFFFDGGNDRYNMDKLPNGKKQCVDTKTGYFAKSGKCDSGSTLFYAKAELTVDLPAFAEVGIGGRFMDDQVRPYGLIAFSPLPKIKVTGAVGQKYLSAGVRLGF